MVTFEHVRESMQAGIVDPEARTHFWFDVPVIFRCPVLGL